MRNNIIRGMAVTMAAAMVVTALPATDVSAASKGISGAATAYAKTATTYKFTGIGKNQRGKISATNSTLKPTVIKKNGAFKVTPKAAAAGKTITVKVVVQKKNKKKWKNVKTYTKKVKVYNKATKVKLNKTTATMYKSGKVTLKATTTPAKNTKAVKWTTNKKAVATVTQKGVVTGKAAGTATITATVDGKKATCKVTVYNKVTGIKITGSDHVNVGSTATLKATVTPASGTKGSVTWKSSDTKIATVSAKGVVTGKAEGDVTITATKDGKSATWTMHVAEKAVAIEGVKLDNTTPKVGDTITASVEPSDATGVTYQWLADNSAIAGATSATYIVAEADLGKALSVTATDDSGNSVKSVETAKVAEKDASQISITKAEQTSAKTVKVTFSDAVTAADKITVKKGSDTLKIDGDISYDADFKGATITLADKIIAAEYTVTLTPADTKVAATEAKFTGAISELKEIKFLNNYLVMKDSKYSKGYAYAKGFDQFGGEVNLSGLTVTPGVGKYEAYDTATGKITIDDGVADNATSPFMTIKEVPVFIQYQQGTTVISAQANLTVSTQAYLSEMTFGEIQKDGTMRNDKRLTVTELSSKKYYVEIKEAKDQYGNALSADDLQAQKDGSTLFVIPGDTGAFYTTGNFGTLNDKTVLWLAPAGTNTRPGTMALTITGAGGNTFTKDVTVEDDPYVDTLTVSYPELYAGVAKSGKMEFTAVDQYGDAFDLWDVKPAANNTGSTYTSTQAQGKFLCFNDKNHMSGNNTVVQVSGNANFNAVDYDSSKKTFTATLNTSGASKSDIVSFVVTSAGMKVSNASITVGGAGSAAKVKSALKKGAPTQLVSTDKGHADETALDFNKYVQFEDANGNTMVRGKSEKYPAFDGDGITVSAVPTTTPTYNSFVWTVSTAKLENPSSGSTNYTVGNGNSTTAVLDANGKIDESELAAYRGGSNVDKGDYYVTVLGFTGSIYNVLDSRSFHLTRVTGTDKSFTATQDGGKLYATTTSTDSDEIKAYATTTTGETYRVKPSRIKLQSGYFEATSDAKLKGKVATKFADHTTATENVSVYIYDGVGTTKLDEITVPVKYSNEDPVATKAVLKYETTAQNDGAASGSLVGTSFDGDLEETDIVNNQASEWIVKDGELTVTTANKLGDKITAKIEDDYGQAVTTTKYSADGEAFATTADAGWSGRKTIEYSASGVSKKFYYTDEGSNDEKVAVSYTASKNLSVSDDTSFAEACSLATSNPNTLYTAEVVGSFTTSQDKEIPSNLTLVVNNPYTLTIGNTHKIDNNGTIKNNGHIAQDTAGTLNLGDGAEFTNGTQSTPFTATMGTVGISVKTNDTTVFRKAMQTATCGTITLTGNTTDSTTGTTVADGAAVSGASADRYNRSANLVLDLGSYNLDMGANAMILNADVDAVNGSGTYEIKGTGKINTSAYYAVGVSCHNAAGSAMNVPTSVKIANTVTLHAGDGDDAATNVGAAPFTVFLDGTALNTNTGGCALDLTEVKATMVKGNDSTPVAAGIGFEANGTGNDFTAMAASGKLAIRKGTAVVGTAATDKQINITLPSGYAATSYKAATGALTGTMTESTFATATDIDASAGAAFVIATK